jgi:hypothetical protein
VDAKAKRLNYDTRRELAELDPKPEFVTVAVGTTRWDIVSISTEDVKGTQVEDPKHRAAWAGVIADAVSALYLEHLVTASATQDSALLCTCTHPSAQADRTPDSRGRVHGSNELGTGWVRRGHPWPRSSML